LEKKKQQTKPFNLTYDKVSERMVLEISDKDAMFPLLFKVIGCDPREIILTKHGDKVQMR